MNATQTVLTLLLCSAFVSAQEPSTQEPQEVPSKSGNAFVRICSAIDKDDKEETRADFRNVVACIGYVEGVVQGVFAEVAFARAATNKAPPAPFCLSGDTENGQIVRITLKYIRNHPEKAHQPTAMLIVEALREAFPCRTKKSG